MNLKRAMCVFVLGMPFVAKITYAGQSLIAAGALDASGSDLANKIAKPLENGVAGNLFGGIGSGLGHADGDRFIAVPDRGPNAITYNTCVDSTTSYITRFHTLRLRLVPNDGAGLPFVLKPSLEETTLMASSTPLTYGDGLAGCPTLSPGAPKLNNTHTFYFSGRSDNFGSGGLGLTTSQIPAKLEGIAFGQDVVVDGDTKHTLFIANDNDFLPTFNGQSNPNQFFVFGFDDEDLQTAFGDAADANLSLEPQIFDKK